MHRCLVIAPVLCACVYIPPAPPMPPPMPRAPRTMRERPPARDQAVMPVAHSFDEPSVQGRPLRWRVFGNGERTVLFLGAIHGSEPMSHRLLEQFQEELAGNPELVRGRRVVVASPVNPDGLDKGLRHNARAVDLNRNFPARNFKQGRFSGGGKPLSEPESRFVMYLLETFRPQVVVSVHAPLCCVNYDGPADRLARAMAVHNGYPVKASIGYPTPGSLGSFLGVDRGVPIVTLELPRGERPDGFYSDNRMALLEVLRSVERAGP
jgi:protein MpaA